MQIDTEFAVPLGQVRDFQLQSRAYEWAEFANVRLDMKPADPGRE
jgi:hypothetical protein